MIERGDNGKDCPRLIEVALPIREISAESVRDKSLRHGHISTLHLWWARRPLAACRAVVFASLVPDPDDPRCPAEFRAAVERHLKTHVPAELKYYTRGRQVHRDEDPYRPYEGMPDTLRNRLLMFIAKWSPEKLAFEAGKAKKEPDPKYLLDDRSLVKWETSDPENPQGREVLRIARELVKVAYGGEVPTVLDPFAGGGAIPLEAGRLGCQAIANDYNPVAYLILRATCEFPRKYGRPGWRRVGGQASSLPSLEPVSTASLFDHTALKATRRNFPHWELDGRIYYVTFSTWDRLVIPEAQRWIVLRALQHWNGDRLRLHQTVVMPDHVHALIEPLKGYELSKVLHSIKSFTANEINRELGRTGPLWQPESSDRIVRDREDYLKKWEYIRTNPVKAGLCERPEEWAWLFEDLVVKQCSLEGCPPTWVPNVLVHHVEKWANWILERAREKIGHLYPPGKDGRPVVGYLWARTVPCSNPSCRAEIPLLRSLLICDKKDKKVALTMHLQPTSSPLPPGEGQGEGQGERSPLPPGDGQGEGQGEGSPLRPGEGQVEGPPLPPGDTSHLSPLPVGDTPHLSPLPVGDTPHLSPLPVGDTPHLSPLPVGEGQGEGQKPALDPEFLAFIRNLRREQTDAERLLWSILRDRRFFGLKFRRQHPLGRYVLDFYCHEQKVAVEIDGGQHFTEEGMRRDARREAFLKSRGIHVLRYTNLEVLENLEGVLEDIARKLGVLTGSVQPSPQPSPEGRGVQPSPQPSPDGRGSQPSPQPSPDGRGRVWFGIAEGEAIMRTEGTKRERGPAICPFCGQPTSEAEIRRAGQAGQMGERMVAVIVEGKGGKEYRPVEESDLVAFREAAKIEVERPGELILPEINAEGANDVANSTGIRVHLYGMKTWGSLFNPRQLVAMQTFVACLREALEAMRQEIEDEEYRRAVGVYLGLWLSRNAMRMTSVGRWDVGGETFQTPFDAQAIPMKWDYPEANPFTGVTGGFENQLEWILHYLKRESVPLVPTEVLQGDGAHLRLNHGTADVVITDPPYFDAIAYSDLSDFFYVWLKRAIAELVPEVMATPLVPKADEATALKHRHGGDALAADRHFTTKLGEVFAEAKRVAKPDGIITVMFAHQSTKAWTALVNALFEAGLTVDATWPIDTELKNRSIALGASALESSITVVCRPRVVGSAASFKQVRKEIEQVVQESVRRFWSYGFRGADLIVACYGPAVGVFGKYERVEKADGTPVGIPELLELARQAARDAIAGEFRGDNLSTLYYVWANLYGTAEQAWDDARLVVQIGGDAENAMDVARGQGIFVVDGSKCRLALLADRAGRRGLGMDPNPPLIDALHRAMLLWKQEKRKELVHYLNERGLLEDGPFWKLAQALFEVLPRDLEDWKLMNALLGERQTLRAEGKSLGYRDTEASLFQTD